EPPIVIEPETEELGGLQKRRDALVRLQHARNRADQVLPRLGHFPLRRPLQTQRTDFGVDGGERPLDVARIDARTDRQRSRPEARVEPAERGGSQPPPAADVLW